MVADAKEIIAEVRGVDYLSNVEVVAMTSMETCYPEIPYGNLYYDPHVYKLMGNGVN